MMELDNDYERDNFLRFLEEDFLTDFKKDIRPVNTSGLSSIQKANYLGESKSLDLQVFEFLFEGSPNKRIALTKDAFSVMRSSAIFRALAVFHSPNNNDWRFSLMTATPEPTEKGKVALSYSNPKRLSFFLGPNAKINTPTKFLISKSKVIDFEDLKNRFSIEVVNKEFYKEISQAFTKLVAGLLKLPDSTDKSQTNLEFAVRLIGRIIFSWFLKEKKNSNDVSLMPKEILSLEAISRNEDYYHNILEPIFFEILNKPLKDRLEKFTVDPYSSIPYLNGGLFSPEKDDFYKRGIYQSDFYNNLVVPDEWLKDFFEILETYNFTIDENTSYDEELSIDPEMLGRIFENLLAEINPETGESARKSTGSYYTPRIIVGYMVDESLLLYLKQQTEVGEKRLRALISYELTDDIDNPLKDDDREKIVNALEKVKILDPACGSGAFPIGALQKIVFILQQVDPDGKLWFKKQLEKATPEFRKDIEKKFSNKEFDFLRKLGVIRECIYGVDIQPIATEISRLRCFLTLIVDEHIDDKEENRGIKPLPNLDFKFVTANSLIGLPKLDDSTSDTQQGLMFDDRENIDELKNIRDQYFTSSGIEREKLKLEFSEQQKVLIKQMYKEHGFAGMTKSELTQKLTDWEPFTHKKTDWFDPEWIFGLKNGFDIVIANPPYVRIQTIEESTKKIFKDTYKAAIGSYDAYILFDELSINLLKVGGSMAFIQSNKFFTADYGEGIRDFLGGNKYIYKIVDFGASQIFDTATTYTCLLFCHKSLNQNFQFVSFKDSVISESFVDYTNDINNQNVTSINLDSELLVKNGWFFSGKDEMKAFTKIETDSIPLAKLTKTTFQGIVTSADPVYILEKRDSVFFSKFLNKVVSLEKEFLKPLLKGSDIGRYSKSKNIYWLIFPYERNGKGINLITPDVFITNYPETWKYLKECKTHLRSREKGKMQRDDWYAYVYPKNLDQFELPKLMVQVLAKKSAITIDDESKFYFVGGGNAGGYGVTLKEDMGLSLKYILGLLNSSTLNFYIQHHSSKFQNGYFSYAKRFLELTPIKKVDKQDQTVFEAIVDKILILTHSEDFLINQKKQLLRKQLESQIDQMVYKLYGLTENEIKIVENS